MGTPQPWLGLGLGLGLGLANPNRNRNRNPNPHPNPNLVELGEGVLVRHVVSDVDGHRGGVAVLG